MTDALKWIDPDDNRHLSEIKHRDEAIIKSLDLNIEEMIKMWVYIDYRKANKLIDLFSYYLKKPFNGNGIDLGAGTGLFSSVLANKGINKVYALEIVPSFINYVIPLVANHYSKEKSHKIIPVLGTFDDIQLPNNSLDFAFEYDAFHHSENLRVTFSAIHQKLKPGGNLLIIDRCHPDSMTDEEVQKLLNIQYSEKFLNKHGYDENLVLTRRENGEQEYRKNEWMSAIENSGFNIKVFRTFYNKVSLKQLYWYMLSTIKGKRGRDLSILKIFLAQNFGIYLSDYNTLTPMRESLSTNKTFIILEKV